MTVISNPTYQNDLHACVCRLRDCAQTFIKTAKNTKFDHLFRLLVVNFLVICTRAQMPHNLPPENNTLSQYKVNNIKYPVSNDFLFRNHPFIQVPEPVLPTRRKYGTLLFNRQMHVSPTSIISRFQYSPSPSEARGLLYRTQDNRHQPPHDTAYDHQAGISNRFQRFESAWSHYGNESGVLNQQASLSQALQLAGTLTKLPEPSAFSELTDKVLLQAYRAKSPCFGAEVDWVRDKHNCSVFFVCSRGRVAAVMTCPSGENWSNRVTNCVPFRSRWDDCIRANQVSHSEEKEVTQSTESITRWRRIGRGWLRLRTTTSFPSQNETTHEQEVPQESNGNRDHRYFSRSHGRSGKYYETGSRRLGIIPNNKRGGYHIESIRGAIKRRQDAPNFQRLLRMNQRFVVKDNSESKRRRHLHNRFHRFEHNFLSSKNIRQNSSGHIKEQISTLRTPSSELDTSRAPNPIAASGSGTRPKIRFVITHGQRKRARTKLDGTKIKSVKDGDLDFLHNIKKINELENGVIGELPVKDHLKSIKDSTKLPSSEESSGSEKDNQWWSNTEKVVTKPTFTTTTASKATTATTTTHLTTTTNHLETTTNRTVHKFLPECGVSATSMIVGGLPAQQGRWPWVVSLQLTWNQNHVCGATLVHQQWIVTAAHCVNGPDLSKANEWKALFWQKRISKQVDIIVQHPEFVNGDNYPNDIALLRLREPVDVSGFDLRHACMPKREEWKKKWEKCWIMGWGESKDDVTSELKELEVKVRKNSECSARWGWKRILNSHVCAGDGGRGACNGDSGGPLICRQNGYHYLAGITSWGVGGCQTAGYPSVFTRVAFYYNWIQGVISAFSK